MLKYFAILVLCLFFSCKREKEKFEVKGVLYKDCSYTIPYANYPLILEYNTKSIREDSWELSLTTSNKGEFSTTYESVTDLINGNLSISFVAGYANTSLISDLPLNTTLHLGNVVKGVNSFVIYKISTNKPYTSNDTLYYRTTASNFAPPYLMQAPYKVGPFKEGQILDTLTKSSLLSFDNSSKTIKAPIYNDWRLGATYFDPQRKNSDYFLLNPCQKYSEVIIDLREAIN